MIIVRRKVIDQVGYSRARWYNRVTKLCLGPNCTTFTQAASGYCRLHERSLIKSCSSGCGRLIQPITISGLCWSCSRKTLLIPFYGNPCPSCGKPTRRNSKYELCCICRYGKTKSCPGCGTLIQKGSTQCRTCKRQSWRKKTNLELGIQEPLLATAPLVGIIYFTYCLVTGKCYVGLHTKGCKDYLGSGIALNRAVRKYGRKNFIRETIDTFVCLKEGWEKEVFWINELATTVPTGYNMNDGGDGGNNPCQETRRKMKAAKRIQLPFTLEHKLHIKEGWARRKGVPFTSEHMTAHIAGQWRRRTRENEAKKQQQIVQGGINE